MNPPMIPSKPLVAPLFPKNRLFLSEPEFPEFLFPRHGLKIWLPRKEAPAPMAAPAMAESRLLLPVKKRVLLASLLLPLWGAALDIRARPVVRRREGSIFAFWSLRGSEDKPRWKSLPKSDSDTRTGGVRPGVSTALY